MREAVRCPGEWTSCPVQSSPRSPAITRLERFLGRVVGEARESRRESCAVTASDIRRVHHLPMARGAQLDLRLPMRWGGRREGAGRKSGALRRDPHRRRESFHRTTPFHVTLKVRGGLPSLRSARFVRVFEGSMRSGCERGRFRISHWSVQRNHLHLIVEASSAIDLGNGMKSVTMRLVRTAQRAFGLGRRGAMVRDRFHLHRLQSPREVRQAIAYVLLNARRHASQRGVALDRKPPRVDPASSGRWFDGWKGRPPAEPSGGGPAVARPRCWLLTVGWRRAGLIDVAEIPGRR